MMMADRYATASQPPRMRATRHAAMLAVLGLLATCVLPSPSWAQKTSKSTTSTGGGSNAGGGSAPSGSGGAPPASSDKSSDLGFSIESEMLTYHSLESNSQAVACDVAAYLLGGSVDFHRQDGAGCDIKGANKANPSVVLLPFGGPTFDDFQTWRTDMEIMRQVRTEAEPYCPESDVAAIAPRGLADLTPAGGAVSALQTAIGLFATQTSTTPVTGTIQDQAFMDGVARELHNLNVTVLIPAIYSPSSLTASDPSQSPFLSSLERVRHARLCLTATLARLDAASTPASDKSIIQQEKPDIEQIVANIDSFLEPFKVAPASTAQGGANSKGADNSGAAAPFPTAAVPTMMTILAADNLAHRLGIDPATGMPGGKNPWEHVLLLKMLESGGTVTKNSTIFGSRTRYSGGSVGTYALFRITGDLECSGNVYAYGGSVSAKHFEKDMRRMALDPSSQFIFRRGGCHPSPGQ